MKSAGILSRDHEIIDDITSFLTEYTLHTYRSIDPIRNDEYGLLLVDAHFFESMEDGQFILSKIRKKLHDVPVILILRVNLLEEIRPDWFINDFILYPFRKGELIRRIERVLWLSGDEDTLTLGNLKINIAEYAVYMNQEKLELTYKEFELMRLFAQNRGTVFSRKELLNHIWGMEYIGGTRTVDVHIRRLRAKLGDEFNSIIETVRNVGYRCREDS
jgi:DNA-binding response OmpR family regulator